MVPSKAYMYVCISQRCLYRKTQTAYNDKRMLDSRGHLIFSRHSPVPGFLVSFFEVDIVLLLLYKIFNILDSAFCLSQYVLSLSLCIHFSLYRQLFLWTVIVTCFFIVPVSVHVPFIFFPCVCIFVFVYQAQFNSWMRSAHFMYFFCELQKLISISSCASLFKITILFVCGF